MGVKKSSASMTSLGEIYRLDWNLPGNLAGRDKGEISTLARLGLEIPRTTLAGPEALTVSSTDTKLDSLADLGAETEVPRPFGHIRVSWTGTD